MTSTESEDHESFVDAWSVGQLVSRRLDPVDPWRLALVQRHLVWDEVRVAHLLDSLLAGYPIGSLLVCRVRQGGHVLREQGATRRAEQASAGTWQLLDGQQRVNALVSVFSEHGKFGRFYLNMLRPRVPDDVITRRADKRRALDYIAWRSDDVGAAEPPDPRSHFIDLSRLHAWAAPLSDEDVLAHARGLTNEPGAVIPLLDAIDDAFADDLTPPEIAAAASRAAALLRAWAEPSVPVQHFTVDAPSDVLQVFARINLAGVRLDGEDVFFAAVKTEWPDAEEHLDRVAAASPLLNRMTALRLLARLASRAHSKDDLLPLRVDRLNGSKGRQLVMSMERLAADDSPVLKRIGVLGQLLTTESAIGYGLRLVDDGLLDHVFAWAAVNEQAEDDEVVRAHLPAIEAYLLGAHGFRYPSIFLDGFLRLGFAEALAAGVAGDAFPTERIIAGARRRWEGLRRGQRWVAPLESDDERRHFVDQNAGLFLSILQQIPYALPDRDPSDPRQGRRQVEWDHIYPQAKADRMRVPLGSGGRPIHHPDRRLVWNGGNLWALDRPINNHASDRYPSAKFALLDSLPDPDRHLPSTWPSVGSVAIAPSERADLLEAERRLEARDVDGAMVHFRAYVVARALRLFDHVITRYPAITRFAPSANVADDLPDGDATINLRSALALDGEALAEDETAEQLATLTVDDDRYTSVLALADRAELGAEVRAVIATALELGLVPRPRQSSVMVAPQANRTRMLFTIWPQSGRGGRISIYRWAAAIAEFFPSIDEATARDALGPDGYGILERDDVPGFLGRLASLLGGATQGAGSEEATLTRTEIRRIAREWLRAKDPDRQGLHYYEIAHAVQAQGPVSGKDQMATVLSAISSNGEMFRFVRAGHYTWVPTPTERSAGAPRGTRYWAMRTDQNKRAELWAEIQAGRLRQGWGWDPDMDLQVIAEAVAAEQPLSEWQQQAWANRKMLTSRDDGIHVGDIVLVPHMPEQRRFSLVRVVGPYEFDGGQAFGDYGHILPVQLLTGLDGIGYTEPSVPPKLQASLGNRIRLWNLDGFDSSIELLRHGDQPGSSP